MGICDNSKLCLAGILILIREQRCREAQVWLKAVLTADSCLVAGRLEGPNSIFLLLFYHGENDEQEKP